MSTDPTTLRGSSLPEESRVVVAIGPHPPPPLASTKPATRPSGPRNRAPGLREVIRSPSRRNANRTSTYSPSSSRTVLIHTDAAPVDSAVSTYAPSTAPTAPGTASTPTVRQSMLDNRQCAAPEASAVPTSARWIAAEATAGAVPTASRVVVAVTPKAMPSEPSTSWARKPARPNRKRVSMRRPRVADAARGVRRRGNGHSGSRTHSGRRTRSGSGPHRSPARADRGTHPQQVDVPPLDQPRRVPAHGR